MRSSALYDACVDPDYDALAAGADVAIAPAAPVDAIGALTHEHASRHVAPIMHN